MQVSACTQPGVQKQPSNTLWVAVFLILEDLTGYNLQLHLEQRNNRLYRRVSDEIIRLNVFGLLLIAYLLLPFRLDSLAIRHHHVFHV